MSKVITPESRLALPTLTIVPEGDDFLVGNPNTGNYVAMPPIGIVVLRELQRGAAIAEVTSIMVARQQDIDVLDFAQALTDAGLTEDCNEPAPSTPQQAAWLIKLQPERIKPFFSRPAWTIYGALFTGCLTVFAIAPQYRPTIDGFFFYPNPAISYLIMTLTQLLLALGHEMGHWLAARAEGVIARFRIGRRLFVLVVETDLSALWSLPRHRRYSPFLAGMAFDTVVLSAALSVRILQSAGLLDLPLLDRFAGAVVLTRVLVLVWQTILFLRTDLYAVMLTALGCTNLYRLTYLFLISKVRRLRPDEQREIEMARPRDRQALRWFAWLYAGGLGLALYCFIRLFIPGTVLMGAWILSSLRFASLGSAAFWEMIAFGSVLLLRAIVPFGLLWRERITLGKER